MNLAKNKCLDDNKCCNVNQSRSGCNKEQKHLFEQKRGLDSGSNLNCAPKKTKKGRVLERYNLQMWFQFWSSEQMKDPG